MSAPNFYNGTTGDFIVGSTSYHITSWKLSTEATELDTTTVADSGYFNMTPGMNKATATIELMYDSTVHGVSPSPIKEGTTGTCKLERIGGDATPFTGTAYITKCDIDHSFNAVMKATLSVTFSGAYTWFNG